jgi:hypothetical protein
VVTRRAVLVAILAAGCTSFENPSIVIDFRILAISADRPEQVIDIDIQDPAPPVELLEQVEPTEICVLVSDREFDRRLRWSMTVCALNNDERCRDGAPQSVFGRGLWDDPDLAPEPPRLCATIPADGNLLGVALDALRRDALRGLGGIYYGVSLRVGGEDDDPALDLYGAKEMRLMPRIPSDIEANTNPSLDGLEARFEGADAAVPLPLGRCLDQPEPLTVAAGQRVRIFPLETEGTREPYVVPTIDGGSRMFTETLTYQWLATAGRFSPGRSGGRRDAFGNEATLWTDWRAPAARDLDGPLDVELWVVQRDERLGLAWYETCLRVVP